jgi:hypothetical protein
MVLYACVGLGFAGAGLAILLTSSHSDRSSGDAGALIGAIFLIPAVYMVSLALRSRVMLEGERITVRGAFRERSAERGEIEGYRTVSSQYGSFRQLKLKEGRGKITIQSSFNTDDDYEAWMQDVPDLDERDKKQLLAEIESQPELGATPEERLGALKRAKYVAIGVTAVAVAAAAGLNFAGAKWVEPCALATMLAPVVAIWMCTRQPLLYSLLKKKADPRGEMFFVFMVAGIGLLMRMREVELLRPQSLLAAMILVGLVLAGACWGPVSRGAGPRAFIAAVIFAGMLAYGGVAVSDVFFDHAKPTAYTASVVGGHVSSGKTTTYYLRLTPWGPVQTEDDVSVAESVYSAAHIGDQVCLSLSPGWLKAAWFRVVPCEEPTAGAVQ